MISSLLKFQVILADTSRNLKTGEVFFFSFANQDISLMSRVFASGPGDWGSISGRVIPKTQKMVLDAASFNTQYYKIWIKGKVDQSKEWSSALLYTSV